MLYSIEYNQHKTDKGNIMNIPNQEHEIHELISISVKPDIDKHALLLNALLKEKDIPGLDLVYDFTGRCKNFIVRFNTTYFKYTKPTFFSFKPRPKIVTKKVDPDISNTIRDLYDIDYTLQHNLITVPLTTEITKEAVTFNNIVNSLSYLTMHMSIKDKLISFNSAYFEYTDGKIDTLTKYKNIVKDIKWEKL